eukprot:SAG31_NODE_42198_length_272_cov_1.329480_1_plen_79_part_10
MKEYRLYKYFSDFCCSDMIACQSMCWTNTSADECSEKIFKFRLVDVSTSIGVKGVKQTGDVAFVDLKSCTGDQLFHFSM